jgi:PhzF family phenazine biosynthesis protein
MRLKKIMSTVLIFLPLGMLGQMPIYIVDAFTDKVFSGNPAAVCPLQEWLSDDVLQSIAFENNLSETAFFVKDNDMYQLRWFTPETEVDLCGHATLASAYVIFEHLNFQGPTIVFDTKSGRLTVWKKNDILYMDFPAIATSPVEIPDSLVKSLGVKPEEVLKGPELYLAVFENEDEIKAIKPDFGFMEKLDKSIIVTAKGNNSIDFVSRFFAPNVGIPEDPVTGFAHCALVPYWAGKLKKTDFQAFNYQGAGGSCIANTGAKGSYWEGRP